LEQTPANKQGQSTPRPRPAHLDAFHRALDGAYSTADRALDEGERRAFRLLWMFLPEPSVARDLRFQHVLASRFLSDAGQQGVVYAALVTVVRGGGSTLDAAFIGVAALVPPALLGLWGGAVADALPKRIALGAVYALQALLCFTLPAVAGTDLAALVLIVLGLNALGQVSGPSESAVVPLVATRRQLASAVSLVNFASSAGTAFGTALLAPVLVRAFDTETAMYVSGGLLLLAASRIVGIPAGERARARWVFPEIRVLGTIKWLARQPAVGTMIVVAVLSGVANIVVQTLAPSYVRSVLHVDPSAAVYVFAPSVAGLALALLVAPQLMRTISERALALTGLSIVTVCLFLLGLVGHLASVLGQVNPAPILEFVGADVNERLRMAALLAFPLGFGVSLTTTSVQTYINRRVPHSYQGRAFALQSTLKNGAAIVPLFSLGVAASAYGVSSILLVAPAVLLALACAFMQAGNYLAGGSAPGGLDVLASFWEESNARPPAGESSRQQA